MHVLGALLPEQGHLSLKASRLLYDSVDPLLDHFRVLLPLLQFVLDPRHLLDQGLELLHLLDGFAREEVFQVFVNCLINKLLLVFELPLLLLEDALLIEELFMLFEDVSFVDQVLPKLEKVGLGPILFLAMARDVI